MKKKRTYKRFDLPSFLAILGCIGMLLFECIFIFELYDRTASQPESSFPPQAAPVKIQANPPVIEQSAPVPAATNAAPVPVTRAESLSCDDRKGSARCYTGRVISK
jgi:hypothetical protein